MSLIDKMTKESPLDIRKMEFIQELLVMDQDILSELVHEKLHMSGIEIRDKLCALHKTISRVNTENSRYILDSLKEYIKICNFYPLSEDVQVVIRSIEDNQSTLGFVQCRIKYQLYYQDNLYIEDTYHYAVLREKIVRLRPSVVLDDIVNSIRIHFVDNRQLYTFHQIDLVDIESLDLNHAFAEISKAVSVMKSLKLDHINYLKRVLWGVTDYLRSYSVGETISGEFYKIIGFFITNKVDNLHIENDGFVIEILEEHLGDMVTSYVAVVKTKSNKFVRAFGDDQIVKRYELLKQCMN